METMRPVCSWLFQTFADDFFFVWCVFTFVRSFCYSFRIFCVIFYSVFYGVPQDFLKILFVVTLQSV
jgi:hypothetical protein